MEKIFLLTTRQEDLDKAYNIAEYISTKYDLNIAITFATSYIKNQYYKQFDINDMVIAFKNNAMLYCLTKNTESIGISLDEYYNSDIFCMTIEAFNNISESMLTNMVVVWIDSKSTETEKSDINNAKILMNTLDSIPYMYFNEGVRIIKDTISAYIEGNNNIKQQILEENN